MRAAHSVLNGMWDGKELPATFIEFLFAKNYGWKLPVIRKLSLVDVAKHLPVLLLYEKLMAKRM